MSRRTYSSNYGYILIAGILILCTLSSHAQRYHFLQYGVEEGLPQSQVEAITQDLSAHLWIGTRGGGLSRFDGHNFVNFTSSDGLVSNQINDLLTDSKGNIWVATDGGVSMIDHIRGGQKLSGVSNYYSGDALPSGPVYCIAEDRDGFIWLGTTGGLIKLIPPDTENSGPASPQAFKINEIYSDVYSIEFGEKFMWLGLEEEIFGFDGVRMLRLKLPANSGRVRDIIEAGNDEILAATNGGIASIELVDQESLNLRTWKHRRNTHVLLHDSKDHLWTGTDNGAIRYEGDKRTAFTAKEGLSSDIIRDIFEDNEGNIWFGTGGGGLNRFSNSRFIQFNIKDDEDVNLVQCFAEDADGNVWMGTYSGLYILEGKSFSPFLVSNIFTRFDVRSVHYDRKGYMWYSIVGFGVFAVKGEEYQHYTLDEGLSSNDVYDITEDSSGKIFLATASGVNVIENQKVSDYLIDGAPLRGRFNALACDHSGRLWAGSQHGALLLEEDRMRQFTQTDGLSSNAVRAICRGERGEMWLGTDNGIIRVDASKVSMDKVQNTSEIFTLFSTGEGMRSHLVNALATDDNNNLWIGTNVGVERFDLQEFYNSGNIRFTYFNKDEGFTGVECNPNAILKDRLGRMWFGTPRGAVVYDPAEDVPNLLPPRLKIVSVRLFEEEVNWLDYVNEIDENALPKDLVLTHDLNYLSFDFIGVSLSASDKVRYKYRVKGFDKDWLPIKSDRSAPYRNLPPGDFVFEVLSSNNNGVWNEEAVVFSFSIQPPYYSEPWFIVLMVVLSLGLLSLAFYLFFNRRIQRKALDERIANLRLNAMRAQMNPHFIFNSLNSIQNFINKNDEESANIYLSQFASLMRLILDNSQQSSIPLGEEVRSLKLYLSLEKLRFKEKFDFEILVDDSVDQLDDQIPTMLIQPYVENALNHGILHKDGKGMIQIAVSKENENLVIQIQDNGIGREKAMEIKMRQAKRHRSAGMGITRERLEILNTISNNNMYVNIEDLINAEGRAAGTLVKITVPLRS